MSAPEAVVLAAVFAGLGVRSLVWWLRRPFETADLRDNLLYAAYLTGRVGLWFAIAGFFVVLALGHGVHLASGDASGNGFVDFALHYGWYLMVIPVLAAVQLVAGFFLGRRSPR